MTLKSFAEVGKSRVHENIHSLFSPINSLELAVPAGAQDGRARKGVSTERRHREGKSLWGVGQVAGSQRGREETQRDLWGQVELRSHSEKQRRVSTGNKLEGD